MKEEDLYIPVKNFFEKQGYVVHGEVNYCDVTAIKDDVLIIIELKKNLSVDLLVQGVLRQKMTSDVYIAVPKFKKLKKYDELKNIIYLLRRLELGLLLVDTDKNIVEVVTEPKSFDLEKSRSRSKKRVASLINEFNKRTVDLNMGGSKGKKLVTAYREQAIYIACILKRYGSQYPRQIRERGGDPKKTLGILKNNYYNWFEILPDGKYALNENGICELDDYWELSEKFFTKISKENKILYLSDLDGTLLNSCGKISDFTKKTLNYLIDKGVLFTVATARFPDTAEKKLDGVNINVPAVLMNGAMIYDFNRKKCIKKFSISKQKSKDIINVLDTFQVNYFMYEINDEEICTAYYREPVREVETDFLSKRMKETQREFVKIDDFKKYISENILYFTIINSHEKILEIYEKISGLANIKSVFYKDTYTQDWFMEIFSIKAGKDAGLKFLKEYTECKYSIVFGDNLNDLEMFREADEAYAVSNANEAVIKAADGVVLSNDEDGTVKFIQANEMY